VNRIIDTGKYHKLINSVAEPQIVGYERHTGLNLRSEIRKIEELERRKGRMLVITVISSLISALAILAFFTFVLNVPAPIEKRTILAIIVGVVFLFVNMICFIRKVSEIDAKQVDSERNLDAFERVINELDPTDIRNKPLREVTVLGEVGIKDNALKLAKRLLLTQKLLAIATKCSYATHDDILRLQMEDEELSRRLSSCIRCGVAVGVVFSRENVIRDVMKSCGVDEDAFLQVRNPYLFHNKGDQYCVCAEALCPDGVILAVYLHTDGVWRSKAVTPDPNDPSEVLNTGFYTKGEAEKILSGMNLLVSL